MSKGGSFKPRKNNNKQMRTIAFNSNSSNRKGFSLLEVLVSIIIIFVGILGIYKLYFSVIHASIFSQKLTTATNLATAKIDELKILGSKIDPDFKNGEETDDIYKIRWTINNYTDIENTKIIKVEVGWDGEECPNNIDKCSHKVILTNLLKE